MPVGGGGLLGRHRHRRQGDASPTCEIVGVEPEHAACLDGRARRRAPGRRARSSPTLADGLAVAQIGHAAVRDRCSASSTGVVTVDEATIALAILRLIELEKSVVEGAGAAPLAAFLAGKLDTLKGKRVVLVLCGGNIDLTILDRVIEVGPRRRRPAVALHRRRSATGPAASRGSPK